MRIPCGRRGGGCHGGCCARLVAILLTLTLVTGSFPSFRAAAQLSTATLLVAYPSNPLVSDVDPLLNITSLVAAGFDLAHNGKKSYVLTRLSNRESLSEYYDKFAGDSNYVAILGPSTNEQVRAYLEGEAREAVLIAPVWQGDRLQTFDDRVASIVPDLKLQVVALIARAKLNGSPTKVGLVYVEGFFTAGLLSLFTDAFSGAVTMYKIVSGQETTPIPEEGNDELKALKGLQAVFFLGPLCQRVNDALAIHYRAISAASSQGGQYIYATYELMFHFFEVTTEGTPSSGAVANVYFSSPFPFADSADSGLVASFRQAYPSEEAVVNYKAAFQLYGYVAGRLFSEVMARYAPRDASELRGSILHNSRYMIQDFPIGDYSTQSVDHSIVPDVGGLCNAGGRSVYLGHGQVAGRDIVSDTEARPVTMPSYVCDVAALQVRYPLAVTAVTVREEPVWESAVPLLKWADTVQAIVDEFNQGSAPSLFASHELHVLPTSGERESDLGSSLTTLKTQSHLTALTGFVTPSLLWSAGDLFVVDPVYHAARVTAYGSNMIHLFSTVEEQVYASLAYLSALEPRPSVGAYWQVPMVGGLNNDGYNSYEAVNKTFMKFAKYFDVPIARGSVMSSADSLTLTEAISQIGIGGYLFYFNILGTAITGGPNSLQGGMEFRDDLRFILMHDDVTLEYSRLSSLTDAEQNRLLLYTNAPMPSVGTRSTPFSAADGVVGTSGNTGSPLPSTLTSPAQIRTYAMLQFLSELAELTGRSEPSTWELMHTLYSRGTIKTASGQYGPYVLNCEVGSPAESCGRNYGATGMKLWTVAQFHNGNREPKHTSAGASLATDVALRDAEVTGWTRPSSENGTPPPISSDTPSESDHTTEPPISSAAPSDSDSNLTSDSDVPAGPPLAPESTPLSKTTVVIIAVAVVVGLLLLALLVLLLWWCCARGDSKDDRNAPVDATQPVTLIFTDIESSTALWALVPGVMSKAVQTHHRVMRELIVKHQCYEVKTIGDSFMIACRSAAAAVALCAEAQARLHATNWGGAEIDGAYRQLAATKARKAARKARARRAKAGVPCGAGGAKDADGVPGGEWALPEAEYAQLWNGLRVRIGVHTGLCDIARDEVTRRFDYYGTTVNIAARTESLGTGGQVLCTCATRAALSDEEAAPYDFVSVGAHLLRGVSEPMEMVQLTTVPGRCFDGPVPEPPRERTTSTAAGIDSLVGDMVTKIQTDGVEAIGDAPAASDANVSLARDEIGGGASDESTSEPEEEHVTSPETAAEVLEVYFSAYDAKEKSKMLWQTCKKLGMEPPTLKQFASHDAWAAAMIQLLAARTTAVIDYRHELATGELAADDLEDATAVLAAASATNLLDLCAVASPLSESSRSVSPLVLASNRGRAHAHVILGSRVASSIGFGAGGHMRSHVLPRSVASRGSSDTQSCDTPMSFRDAANSSSRRRLAPSTKVLVFDTGEAVELCSGDRAESESTTPEGPTSFSDPRSELGLTVPSTSPFTNGAPSVPFDKVVPCFSSANGLLFRLTSTQNQTWAYYNDTRDYIMVVRFSLGRFSRVTAGGEDVVMRRNEETHRYEGELTVRPLETRVMVRGRVNGFKLKYNAFESYEMKEVE